MTQSILLFLAVFETALLILWIIDYAKTGKLAQYIMCFVAAILTALFWALFYASKN
jgi:hypothetical protein